MRRLVRRRLVGQGNDTINRRGGMREGRVLSRVSPATPSCMKRSCQRQTTVLPLPTVYAACVAVGRLISRMTRMFRARSSFALFK
jgi:hypothetical protein